MDMAAHASLQDDLFTRARAGEATAFGQWLALEYDFIYRVAYRLLGQRADAEDLAQDVCVRLPGLLSQYAGRGSVRAWLGQITLNAGRDRLRQRARRPQVSAEVLEDMAATSSTAEQVYLQQVWRMIGQLPDTLRDTLLLSVEGLTQAEIAVALDCKEGTVAWRISEARAQLTARLEGGRNGTR